MGLFSQHGNEQQAISLTFLAAGFLVVTWAANIPAVVEAFRLSIAHATILIIGVGTGAFLSMARASPLIHRFGISQVIFVSGIVSAGMLSVCFLAPCYWGLLCMMVVFGAATGIIDAAMNAAACAYELNRMRQYLSYFHAFFSLGGMFAAMMVWAANSIDSTRALSCPTAASAALLILYFGSRGLRNAKPVVNRMHSASMHGFLKFPPPLWGLGALAATGQICEGAIHDWSAILLSSELGGSIAQGALGLATFTGAVAVARFAGNALRRWLGDTRLLALSSLLVAGPLFLGAMSQNYPAMVLAIGLSGLGIANIFPLLISIGARLLPRNPIQSTVWLSLCGYTGLLGGPALVGGIAGRWGMLEAFYVIAALATLLTLGGACSPYTAAKKGAGEHLVR